MIFPIPASSASRSPFLDSQPLTLFLIITFSSLLSNFKFPLSSLHLWPRLGQGERRYGSGAWHADKEDDEVESSRKGHMRPDLEGKQEVERREIDFTGMKGKGWEAF